MLRSLLRYQLLTVGHNVRLLRTPKPNIMISEQTFQITIHLQEFTLDEITVKAHPDYLLVEGKQEKDTNSGLMIRQFTRKFKLPKGCNVKKIQSKFSPDGVLTVTAIRADGDLDTCDIIEVPINSEGKMRGRKVKDTTEYLPYCQRYAKVKPRPPNKAETTEPKSKKEK